MKVYKDFDDVIKPTEVPKKLWKYENLMKEKPKFNKKEYRRRLALKRRNDFEVK